MVVDRTNNQSDYWQCFHTKKVRWLPLDVINVTWFCQYLYVHLCNIHKINNILKKSVCTIIFTIQILEYKNEIITRIGSPAGVDASNSLTFLDLCRICLSGNSEKKNSCNLEKTNE